MGRRMPAQQLFRVRPLVCTTRSQVGQRWHILSPCWQSSPEDTSPLLFRRVEGRGEREKPRCERDTSTNCLSHSPDWGQASNPDPKFTVLVQIKRATPWVRQPAL